MTRVLPQSAAFVRAARLHLKKHPEFEFVQHEGTEAILLQNIGTHDEVY